jgi:hypothetical protein
MQPHEHAAILDSFRPVAKQREAAHQREREGGREGGREEGRKGGREGRRKGERERGRDPGLEETLDLYSGRMSIEAYSKDVFLRPARWHSMTVEVRIGTTCAAHLEKLAYGRIYEYLKAAYSSSLRPHAVVA